MIFNTHNILVNINLHFTYYFINSHITIIIMDFKKKTGISLFLLPSCDYTHKNNSEINVYSNLSFIHC